MKTYARITAQGQRFILKVTGESDQFLIGVEVKKDGDEVTGKDFDIRKRIIQKTEITRRVPMKFNNVYGVLENA